MRFLALPGILLALALAPTEATAPTPPPPPGKHDPMAGPLVSACLDGSLDRVVVLMGMGANPNAPSGINGDLPLIAARNSVDIVKYLLAHGANPNATDNEGDTPLYICSYWGYPDSAAALLDGGASPQLRNKDERLPLMNAAFRGNDTIVQLLLDHHADVNGNNDDGPPLWRAVEQGHISTAKLLLAAGANIKLKPGPGVSDRRSWSLLGLAAHDDRLEILKDLLDRGLDINDAGADGQTGLMTALLNNQPLAAAELLKRGADVNRHDQTGWTALMLALTRFHQAIFDSLLQADADVNAQNEDGETPLILAIAYQKEPVWDALLQHGANLEAKDKLGRTPLILSCFNLDSNAAEFLLDRGADVNVIDAKGETALDYAGDQGATSVVEMLKKHGAKRTAVHILSKGKPTSPLSPTHAWDLATGAIYAQVAAGNPLVLGYPDSDTLDETRTSLKKSWHVTDTESLRHQLDWLRTKGHRTGFQSEGAKWSTLDDSVFDVMSLATSIPVAKATRRSYLKWKDRSGLAWDLCRYVALVNWGYTAQYLTEPEAWDAIAPVAKQLQTSFSSWQEMSDNFLDGREIWNDGERDEAFDKCAQLLLDPHESNSPWNQNRWETDLSAP